MFRGDARSNTICEHFQFVIVLVPETQFRFFEIPDIYASRDFKNSNFTRYFYSIFLPFDEIPEIQFEILKIPILIHQTRDVCSQFHRKISTERQCKNQLLKNNKIQCEKLKKDKGEKLPVRDNDPAIFKRRGRGSHEFVSRSIYPCRPFRLGEGTTRRGLLPKLGAEFSLGRHLAALSAPVHVERSQRPVIVA